MQLGPRSCWSPESTCPSTRGPWPTVCPSSAAHLDEALPDEIDPAELVDRYVPNLHPEPFSLERYYVEAVAATCGGRACVDILADWDSISARPARLARELLVELLAWQFASPVRWIETTDVLLGSPRNGGLGARSVVEVGVGSAPTLTNLTKAAAAADGHDDVVVRHVETDRPDVFEETEGAEPASPVEQAGRLHREHL